MGNGRWQGSYFTDVCVFCDQNSTTERGEAVLSRHSWVQTPSNSISDPQTVKRLAMIIITPLELFPKIGFFLWTVSHGWPLFIHHLDNMSRTQLLRSKYDTFQVWMSIDQQSRTCTGGKTTDILTTHPVQMQHPTNTHTHTLLLTLPPTNLGVNRWRESAFFRSAWEMSCWIMCPMNKTH